MRKPTTKPGKMTLAQYKKSNADVREDKASAKAAGMSYKSFKKTPTATRIDKDIVTFTQFNRQKGENQWQEKIVV